MTRKVLRILGSRYGIAAILLVIVIVIIGIARANGGTDPDTTVDGSDSVGTEDAGEPNDGVATEPGDDSTSEESNLPKAAVTAATKFAESYIDTDRSAKEWRAEFGKYATQNVKDQLKNVDPEMVGIKEITDDPSAEGQTVKFPTDAGLLILRMKVQDEVWLVDGVDLDKS